MARTLRELEQRWNETGSLADEARLLLARRREGLLSDRRLEQAAHLRYPAALLATGRPIEPELPEWRAWTTEIEGLGADVVLRVAIAEGRRSLAEVSRGLASFPRDHWFSPSAPDLRAWVDLCWKTFQSVEDYLLEGGRGTVVDPGLYRDSVPDLLDPATLHAYWTAQTAITRVRGLEPIPLSLWPGWSEDSLSAIHDEVGAWLVGHPDPLRARARQLRVAAPCANEWRCLPGSGRVRACEQCGQNVYKLSGLTRAEAESLVRSRERTDCVRYYAREDGSVVTRDCSPGLTALRRKLPTAPRSSWAPAPG